MDPAARRAVPLAALLALGCAGPSVPPGADVDRPVGRGADGAIVLEGAELHGRGQPLLRLLDDRFSGIEVSYGGPCPAIQIRGRKSLFGSNGPLIYVDGARALDTCVLDDLAADAVRRIEVYPSGAAHKPGYDSSRNGLILVFVLDGS